jgi:hypothetical protein
MTLQNAAKSGKIRNPDATKTGVKIDVVGSDLSRAYANAEVFSFLPLQEPTMV